MQKQQTTAGGEPLSFDYTFDIPVEVAPSASIAMIDGSSNGVNRSLPGSMSQSGQKRSFCPLLMTSGFTLSTDIFRVRRHVSNVPPTDIVLPFTDSGIDIALRLAKGQRHENTPSSILAFGRECRRASDHLAHREGASLSVATDPARYSFSTGWCIRRRWTPVGG